MTVHWGTVTGFSFTAWPIFGIDGAFVVTQTPDEDGKTADTGKGVVGRIMPGWGMPPLARLFSSLAVLGWANILTSLLFCGLLECLSISLYTRLSRSMKSTLLFDLFVIVDLRKVLDDNSELHCSVVGWVA